ncbi:hypothetical protein [Halomonas populi]|nr:hypothetical protein ELY40_02835 [Halomonas populi]
MPCPENHNFFHNKIVSFFNVERIQLN